MKKNTRFAFNAYLQQLARLNGVAVEELSSKFTVEPSVQQTLEDQIQQSAAFLTLINVTPVTEQSGQLLGLGVGSTIAGTTDTTAKEREPVDPTLMVDVEYKCEQTNFDTVLTYAKLDLWAKFQDFQVRIRDAIVKRQALDRIMIGFNGVKRAKTSNRSENPLLQDVNKGWLQKIREDAPDHVMGSSTTGGETTPGAVKVGKGGEYANLDAVVMDAVNELIDVVYQDDDDLVVICGRELLSDKYFPLVNKEQENSEKLAADMIISQKRMGGLQAVRAPFFPPNALLITRLDNLSIYWQEDNRAFMPVFLPSAVTAPMILVVVSSSVSPCGTRTTTVTGFAWSAMASSERASVPDSPALPLAVSTSVISTGLLRGNIFASASSPVQTIPTMAVLTVVMDRVPSLISTTRTPWW